MKTIINKIFAPINRWQFIFSVFLLFILTNFLIPFYWSFVPDYLIYTCSFCIPIFCFLIVLKRFFDICEKHWAVIWSIVSLGFLFLLYFISLNVFFNSPIFENTRNFMRILPVYVICRDILIIFLAFKKGKSSQNTKLEIKTVLKRAGVICLIFCAFFLLISNYAASMNSSPRMYPSIEDFDNYLLSKNMKLNPIKRGDIVCINAAPPYLLRVVGLPNETIELKGKEVYINGKLYDDKYAFYSKNLEPINFKEKIKLDDNSYFVIGDNRYYDISGKIWRKVGNKKKKNIHWEWTPLEKLIITYRDDNGKIFATVNKNRIKGKVVAVRYEVPSLKKKKNLKRTYKFSFIKNEFGFKEKTYNQKRFGREE